MRDQTQGNSAAPWRCPVCRAPLATADDGRRWACPAGHSFDVAREGYVNLLISGQRRSRPQGDSQEMVRARRRFLATGAYDPLSAAVARTVALEQPEVILDAGCGEGRHTRVMSAPVVLGVDVARDAVAAAARADAVGWYAVASAADLPLADAAVDVAVCVFGPVFAEELARVVRPGGAAVMAHPGPAHLPDLRALVFPDACPHEVKPPLRDAGEWFSPHGSLEVTFTVPVPDGASLHDLYAMTPYWWHGSPDIEERLGRSAPGLSETVADVRLTTYRRTWRGAE